MAVQTLNWLSHPFILTLLISSASASNILFFHLSATASHRTAIWPLAEMLADSGHNVTYIFPMSNRVGEHSKIEEIQPSKLILAMDKNIGQLDINLRLNNTIDLWTLEIFRKQPEFCEAFYDSPEIQEWLAKPALHYDLIFIDAAFGQCAYGLVHKFKSKQILFNPTALNFLWEPFGLVPESSSLPEFAFHRHPTSMGSSIWSRTISTISPFLTRAVLRYNLRQFEATAREKLGLGDGEMPGFEEIEQETSLVLNNAYFIEDYPMALPPMFVSYSGLACSKREIMKRKPLPKNLTAFIEDGTSDGFVYVSFGTIVDLSAMPEDLKNKFFNAFAKFPNLKFLWKLGGGRNMTTNLPRNVFLQDWFPQLDILAHPKIKAFVSQVGRSSSQEAICHGVPLIAMPILCEQEYNAARLEYIGAALVLDITSLTTEKLVQALQKVIETDTYKQRLKELSAMYRDRPVDPLENAHFWVEYVLRHNTSLLKPLAMNQSWWKRRLLDVYIFILLMLLTFVGALVLVGVLIFKSIKLLVVKMKACKVGQNTGKNRKTD